MTKKLYNHFQSIKYLIFYCLSFCFLLNSSAQIISQDKDYGIAAGLVVSVGTHINQAGVYVRTYYTYNRFQWNNDIRLNYYLRNLGPKKSHPEFQLSSGLVVGYGKKRSAENIFINKTSNQTLYENSIAYAFNAYFNTVKTSQQTGTIGFQWDNIYLNVENDLFAHSRLDRFRTGALQIAYQHENIRVSITEVMWTGQLGKPVYDTLYPSPNGYLDTTNAVYPFLSHGLLFAGIDYIEPQLQQQLRGNIGIDAEQTRHTIQNKFMHDELFLPRKWRDKNNHHFPMIDSNQQFYLFKPNQKVRKSRFYFNTFLNPDKI